MMGDVVYLRRCKQNPPCEETECRRVRYIRTNVETAVRLALSGDYYLAAGVFHCLSEACRIWAGDEHGG